MPQDSNGMEHIYASLAGGFTYTMNNSDPESDNHLQLGGSVDRLIDKGSGWWTVNNPNQVRISPRKFPEFQDSDGGCDADFALAEKRLWMYKSTDYRDVEVKMLVDVRSLSEHILLGGPTGHHPSNSNPCCQGNSYFNRFQNTTPFKVQTGKEMFHNEGYESLDALANAAVHSTRLQDQIIGICYCRYNATRSDGQPSVIIEAWIDPNADGKGWKLFRREEDYKGRGWFKNGAEGTVCNGAKDQPLFWGNGSFRIRWDDGNSDVRFKSISLREIAPFAPVTEPGGGSGGGGSSGGGNVPEAPTFGIKPITFRRHFNFYKGNSCAVAGGGASNKVYEQLTSNGTNGSDLDGEGFYAGEVCKNTASKLFGAIISSGTVYLTKVGAGTDVQVQIRDSANNIKATLATITAASIGTSETACPFTSSPTNTYAMKVNDRFCVVENGAPTSSNYIAVARHSSVSYDGDNSKRFTYYGSYSEESGDMKAVIFVY